MVFLQIVFTFMCILQNATANRPDLTELYGEYRDTNGPPFPNMAYGLRAYNIMSGNPFHSSGDPGFGGQIFVLTKINEWGQVEMQDGITASGLSFCQRTMSSTSFSTLDSYRQEFQFFYYLTAIVFIKQAS